MIDVFCNFDMIYKTQYDQVCTLTLMHQKNKTRKKYRVYSRLEFQRDRFKRMNVTTRLYTTKISKQSIDISISNEIITMILIYRQIKTQSKNSN